MARLARTVVAGLPHHVTQRGNRREAIFFEDGDQGVYRDLLAEQTRKAGVEVWAYCLMPNHVHLILTPTRADGLARAGGRGGASALHQFHQDEIQSSDGVTPNISYGGYSVCPGFPTPSVPVFPLRLSRFSHSVCPGFPKDFR
jgi:REP element-mobilizing transposase RayT